MIAPEIKKILKELIPFKRNLVIVAISGIIMAVCQASVVMLIKNLMDNMNSGNLVAAANTVTEGSTTASGATAVTIKIPFIGGLLSNFPDVNQWVLNHWSSLQVFTVPILILVLYFILGVSRYFHLYLMNFTGELVTQNIRHKLQQKFMRLNLNFHNNFSSGSGGLLSRILNDVIVIQNGLRMFADFFREPIILFALLGWLFYLNWRLTLGVFVVLPLILIFLRQISKTIKIHSIKGQEDLETVTGTIKESLDGVRVIQSFNLESEMSNRFLRNSEDFLYSRKKIHKKVELAGPVTEFVATAVILVIMSYIGYEISQGRSTIGVFGSYLASLLGLSQPIKKLQESYVRIQETVVAARRVYSLLEDPNEVPEIPTTEQKKFPTQFSKITYDHVYFAYGEEMILKNIEFEVKKGQMVAFVGASGSGKSTIVNLLERFFDPTQGQICIDGISIRDFSLKELRKNVALVNQDVFLFSESIARNIWSGDFSKSADNIERAAKLANANDFILRTPNGYNSRVGDRGNLLSGGEKQRVSIARAILKDAPILILDEATSALDSKSEQEVQKGLDQLMQGRTTFVIAHRLSTIAKADMIFVLRNGEIVEQGNHASLIQTKGEYFKLYELQKS